MKILKLIIKDPKGEAIRKIEFEERGVSFIYGDIQKPNDLGATINSLGKTLLIKCIDYIFGANEDVEIIKERIHNYTLNASVKYNNKLYEVIRILGNSSEIQVDGVPYSITKYKDFFGIKRSMVLKQLIVNKKSSIISYRKNANKDDFAGFLLLLGIIGVVENVEEIYKLQDEVKQYKKNKEDLVEFYGDFNSKQINEEIFFVTKEVERMTDECEKIASKVKNIEIVEMQKSIIEDYSSKSYVFKKTKRELEKAKLECRRLTEFVRNSNKVDVSSKHILAIYEQTMIEIPVFVKKRIEEVESFHQKVFEERKIFLNAKKTRIEKDILEMENKIKVLSLEVDKLGRIISINQICREAIVLYDNYNNELRELRFKEDDSYGGIIKKIEKEIANLDQWQKKAAYEIPEGSQRIRGLAGTGKTIVLALKAAYLHTQYPDMKIVITYYTRSLYQQYVKLVTDFVRELARGEVDWDNLHIMHAWGSASESGIYSSIADNLNTQAHNLTSAINKVGQRDTFSYVCEELLDFMSNEYEPTYDAVLIDEAQDMPSGFFRLVFADTKKPKRIIWAYDELQNLSEIEMPSLEEMFGKYVTGSLNVNIENTEGEAKRDITLPICYRNPPWTLTMAHSLGFGLYHDPILQMFESLESWRDIGYTVKSGKLEPNNIVKLGRKNAATPKFFDDLLKPTESIVVQNFDSKEKQYAKAAEEILKNIQRDELDPDDILVIFPNIINTKKEYRKFEKHLEQRGIRSVLAGVTTNRDIFRESGSITCSQIYRAKGNEASMVYILNSDFCADGMELTKLRNILFTAITRSRAWVRIYGAGQNMEIITKEINKCKESNYEPQFQIPTIDQMKKTRKLYRERTSKEKQKVEEAKLAVSDLIESVKLGELDANLVPELRTLSNLIRKS
ncbi:MAG: ATP-binding domain-containing protein [Clostridiales bacterium]|nr:ATP-binding domain-containing protein [Clostridiales bacterium]